MKLERKLDITTDWSAMKFITATFMHIQLDLGLIVSLRNCPKIKSTLQSLRFTSKFTFKECKKLCEKCSFQVFVIQLFIGF